METAALISELLQGNVKGTWHVKNQYGHWDAIYDENDEVVGYAYWRADRDRIVSAHNLALALQLHQKKQGQWRRLH